MNLACSSLAIILKWKTRLDNAFCKSPRPGYKLLRLLAHPKHLVKLYRPRAYNRDFTVIMVFVVVVVVFFVGGGGGGGGGVQLT